MAFEEVVNAQSNHGLSFFEACAYEPGRSASDPPGLCRRLTRQSPARNLLANLEYELLDRRCVGSKAEGNQPCSNTPTSSPIAIDDIQPCSTCRPGTINCDSRPLLNSDPITVHKNMKLYTIGEVGNE